MNSTLTIARLLFAEEIQEDAYDQDNDEQKDDTTDENPRGKLVSLLIGPVSECLEEIDSLGEVPKILNVYSAEFDFKALGKHVYEVMEKWENLKSIITLASSNGADRITNANKKLFTDSPAIKKLMGDGGVGGNSSPSLFSKMRALFSEINTKMWKSELHLLFLGFRSNSHGRILPVELFKGVKAASEVLDGGSPLYEKSTEDFMLLFTAEHVGCIYKLMSYFGYGRPMSQSLSQADLTTILTHSDVDSYVELAAYHLRKIFGDKDHIVANKDFNFNILRLVYNTYYMG